MSASAVHNEPLTALRKSPSNPRRADPARMALLQLSLRKLGFVMPVYADPSGLLLSGHQRYDAAQALGITHIPVVRVAIDPGVARGINTVFNRSTNDLNAFDTGRGLFERLNLAGVLEQGEALPDFPAGQPWYTLTMPVKSIKGLARQVSAQYDKKSVVMAQNLLRQAIQIPLVQTQSGALVNGVHRLFAAREAGIARWPVVVIPDQLGEVAQALLNYLSMDFDVSAEFAQLLRASAYRRPQNNRGIIPKAMRFWMNGERVLLDKEAYRPDYWARFRELHGQRILDFGAGLGRVAPYLTDKGFTALDFEPYRIDPVGDKSKPCPVLSRQRARQFLQQIADPALQFDSIFLASVLNSIPFPEDRQKVLCIVHALSSFHTQIFGTCRDISDFHYEYSGIRNAAYFVFDSEPGVRIGDTLAAPKIQKFCSREETAAMLGKFWVTAQTWPGGNIHYWRAQHPKRINYSALVQSLQFEFDLPYHDQTTMGLAAEAVAAFSQRLGVDLNRYVAASAA